ncbi:hypothetical protein CPB83DRAFT_501469 [Crepidotus variabilis]|uniref:Uncharacterized protein n=1 Tax=Crepidotus variabilis TaxID=179855 RepID=A0A9P6EC26_9AGAR|nr:hypothetical protein CPB83DRAFT_501469 [Crepidotus variabilis]
MIPASRDRWPGWPLFLEEYSKFERLHKTEHSVVSSAQQIAAFYFLLQHESVRIFSVYTQYILILNDQDLDIHQQKHGPLVSGIAAALQRQSAPARSRFLCIIRYLGLRWIWNCNNFMHKSSLSALDKHFDLAFIATLFNKMDDGAYNFFQFEVEDNDVRIYIDVFLVEILLSLELVGRDVHLAYRETVLLSISDLYDESVISRNLESFQNGVDWLNQRFNKDFVDPGISKLNPEMDSIPGSAMSILLTRISMNPPKLKGLFIYSLSQRRFVQLMLFIVETWVNARTLGPSFQNIVRILNKIIISSTQSGVLAVAFDQKQAFPVDPRFKFFQALLGKQNPIRNECLDALSRVDHRIHTVIVEYALKCTDLLFNEYFKIDIPWIEHFTKANYSGYIISRLHNLYLQWPCICDDRNFVPESFIRGILAWKQVRLH